MLFSPRNSTPDSNSSNIIQATNYSGFGKHFDRRSYILVVVQQSASIEMERLQREFRDFVKMFLVEKYAEDDEELRQRTRFYRWKSE